jgi:hypothetical protein
MIADVPDDETIALRVTLQHGALAVPRREIPIPSGSIGWIFGGTYVTKVDAAPARPDNSQDRKLLPAR